jgi:hypothetical protein
MSERVIGGIRSLIHKSRYRILLGRIRHEDERRLRRIRAAEKAAGNPKNRQSSISKRVSRDVSLRDTRGWPPSARDSHTERKSRYLTHARATSRRRKAKVSKPLPDKSRIFMPAGE